jgi:hypothetical protein
MHLEAYIIRSTNKEDKIGGTCSVLETDTRRIKVMVGKYKKNEHLAKSRHRWNDGTEVYVTGIYWDGGDSIYVIQNRVQ